MLDLTDDMLKIPAVVARKYARGNEDLADELASVGNLALVLAAAKFDPARGEPTTYLFTCVKHAIANALDPKRKGSETREHRHASLEALEQPVGGEESSPGDDLERLDLTAAVLKKLRPLDRACALLRWRDELSADVIGGRLGKSSEWVRWRLAAVRKRIGKSSLVHDGMRWHGRYPAEAVALAKNRPADLQERLSRAAAQGHARQKLANIALNHIGPFTWLLVDYANRRLIGPFARVGDALASQGVTGMRKMHKSPVANRLIWRAAALGFGERSDAEARVLDLLASEELTVEDLAARLPGTIANHYERAADLLRDGLIEVSRTCRRPRQGTGSSNIRYLRLSAAARKARTVVCRLEAIRGRQAVKLRDDGYTLEVPTNHECDAAR